VVCVESAAEMALPIVIGTKEWVIYILMETENGGKL
jgi:hypothetical protein